MAIYCVEDFRFITSPADLLRSFNDQLDVSSSIVSGSISFTTIVDPYGVSRQVLRLENGQYFGLGMDANPATVCFSFQVYLGVGGGLSDQTWPVRFDDGATTQCYVSFVVTGSDHIIKAYRGDGLLLGTASTAATMFDHWHQVSVKATIGESGAISVYLDGDLVLNLLGVDTRMTGNDRITKVLSVSTSTSLVLCDFVCSDDHYMPPLRVVTALGNADGDDIAWTASAGQRWECLDDLPRSITDYIYSSTVAAEDSVKVPALPISGSVHTVVQQIYARKSDTDIRRIKQFVKSGTKSYGSAVSLTGTETIYVRKMDLNPVTSSAWQTSDFGASGAQFGVRMDS